MNQSSCLLAIECATGPCSVAIWKNGTILAYTETKAPVAQSAKLIPMIEQALVDSSLKYNELNAIACTIGPGSFTSIRVGLATARGICMATGTKGLGYTTLEVLAHAARAPYHAILYAGKGEFYHQHFAPEPLHTPQLGRLPDIVPDDLPHPRADTLAMLAAEYPERAQPLTPLYIRPPDAIKMAENR